MHTTLTLGSLDESANVPRFRRLPDNERSLGITTFDRRELVQGHVVGCAITDDDYQEIVGSKVFAGSRSDLCLIHSCDRVNEVAPLCGW